MDIIPAIDIIEGKCVRLKQGDFTEKEEYTVTPLDMATYFEAVGCTRVHLVDLEGAKEGKLKNVKTLEKISVNSNLHVDFGGGIKTTDDVQQVFELGATFVTLGSMAVKNENLVKEWFENFGVENFIIGADVKDEKIMIDGWQTQTDILIYDFIKKYSELGVHQFFCTDIALDGMMNGPSIELYKKIIEQFPEIYFIASGGVRNMTDVAELKSTGCNGVIIGKAIYEKQITLREIHKYNIEKISSEMGEKIIDNG